METPELLPVAMTPQNTKDYLAILKRRWDKIYDDKTINDDTFKTLYTKFRELIRVYIEHKMNLSWCTDIPDIIREWAVTATAYLFAKYLYADTEGGNRWENEKFRDKNIDLFFYGEHASDGFCRMFVKEIKNWERQNGPLSSLSDMGGALSDRNKTIATIIKFILSKGDRFNRGILDDVFKKKFISTNVLLKLSGITTLTRASIRDKYGFDPRSSSGGGAAPTGAASRGEEQKKFFIF
jgi:hypothetical protein